VPFLFLIAALALVLWLGPPTLRLDWNGEALSLSLSAAQGSLAASAGVLWDSQGLRPQASATWTPAIPMAEITFTTDSLDCILVKPGQELQVGDLIGYSSAAVRERIEELTRKLPEVQDELVRAEALAEIAKLKLDGELRSLIPGRVIAVNAVQDGRILRVRILVEKHGPYK